MDVNFALEDYEVARGFVLTCQSYPVTDKVTVDYDQIRTETRVRARRAGAIARQIIATSEEFAVPHPLFERHRATLERALAGDRRARLLERVSRIGEPEGLRRRRGRGRQGRVRRAAAASRFRSTQPGTVGTVGGEKSPYGFPLGITYPKADLDALFAAIARRKVAVAQGAGRRRGSACASRSCTGSTSRAS